ncbi:TadE/TadG family type IV pilus assembly protein [Streptomyces sp. NPDC050161]|uniref:TadE/TadG family type IV pilus assembly protein n=1 Tax=Streptomyces sp. NPDC050161 TaxID=3365604 RepID=UPI0037AFEFD2
MLGYLRSLPWREDRGGIAVFVAIITIPLIALGGLLVVDGLGRLRAVERADALALEAARAGAQGIDAGQAVTGAAVTADPRAAAAAARTYLSRSGVEGTVTVHGGTDLSVSVHDTYSTKFLSLVGVTSMPADGHGRAALLHGVTVPERDLP